MEYRWLGRVPYGEAEALQEELVRQVLASGGERGFLLALEHPHVVTLGRCARPEHLLLSRQRLEEMGVEVRQARRGGDITWHGPGQVVLYPILPLFRLKPDLHWYLRTLEEAGMRTLAAYGLAAGRKKGLTGVWVGEKKVMAIGVAVRHWVSFHGAALNVAGPLEGFRWIVPCGIRGKGVTSIERETGRRPAPAGVARTFARELARAAGFLLEEAAEEVGKWSAGHPGW